MSTVYLIFNDFTTLENIRKNRQHSGRWSFVTS